MAKDNGKSIGLDLSKFSHVSHDDSSHTLKHYEGHEIKLATKALSKANREALKAMAERSQARAAAKGDGKPSTPEMMAEGGEVIKKEKYVASIKAPSAAKGVDAANKVRKEGDASPNGITIAVPGKEESKEYGKVSGPDGKKPQVFAEGGDVLEEIPQIPASLAASSVVDAPAASPFKIDLPDLSAKGVEMAVEPSSPASKYEFYKKNYPHMNDSDIMSQMNKEDAAKHMGQAERIETAGKQQSAMAGMIAQKQARGIPLSPAEQAAMQAEQGGQAAPGAMPSMQADPGVAGAAQSLQKGTSQPGSGGGPGDIEGMMASGYGKQMAGIDAQAKAVGDLGMQQAAVLQKQQAAQELAKSHFQEQYKGLEAERQAMIADVRAGYVDPNKYWTGDKDGNGSHSKVMAGIGMILAGFNPTTSPNAAQNFLKYQMDQNIQAQQKNLDQKNNLLSANLRQFGNLKDATEMTRIMQNDMVVNQLQQAAATAQTPMAKAAAMQAAGKLQMETAPMFQQFAMRRAMMSLGNSPDGKQNPEAIGQMINYMRMTNPEQAKSMEARYVPGVGLGSIPIPDPIRTEMVGKQNFEAMANNYIKFVKANSGSLNPKVITQGAAMAAELQGAYRQAINGGQYKEGEQEFIEKVIPADPTQFAGAFRTLPKVMELVHNNQIQANNLKKNYGLPVEQQQAAQEPQYAMKGGVKYMKVPGGWKAVK